MASVLELAELSAAAYETEGAPPGWARSQQYDCGGFYAAAFTRVAVCRADGVGGGSLSDRVLAFRGTEPTDLSDLVDDWSIFRSRYPATGKQAEGIAGAARTTAKAAGETLYLTGHSLGGGLASLAAVAHGLPAVTFNAPGVYWSCLHRSAALGAPAVTCETGQVGGAQLLNIRLSGDAVSRGTGPAMGHVLTLPSQCAVSVTAVLKVGPAIALIQRTLCAHGMASILQILRGRSEFHRSPPFPEE